MRAEDTWSLARCEVISMVVPIGADTRADLQWVCGLGRSMQPKRHEPYYYPDLGCRMPEGRGAEKRTIVSSAMQTVLVFAEREREASARKPFAPSVGAICKPLATRCTCTPSRLSIAYLCYCIWGGDGRRRSCRQFRESRAEDLRR